MKNIIILFCLFLCSVLYSYAQEITDESMFDFTSKAKIKKKEKLNDSPYAMFGDNTTVLKTDHERNLDHSLKIPLLEDDKQIGLFELNFQTGVVTIKDADGTLILNQELSQDQLSRFLSIDPLAEKYYSWSPYVYVMNNPMKYIDPDGCSTWVMQNSDGTYRVVGGDLDDKDYNIYVYSIQEGNLVRGNSIGVTTSITSFYNSDDGTGVWATESIIDPNDSSGQNFLSDLMNNTPNLTTYMENGTGGGSYDFKRNGTSPGSMNYDNPSYHYRGMPVGKTSNGTTVYSSARDIGNIGAGYVSGRFGFSWSSSRDAFDALESYQKGRLATEGISTQNAERYGWNMGHKEYIRQPRGQEIRREIREGLNAIPWAIKKVIGR